MRTRRIQLVLGLLGLLPCLACFSPSEGDRTSSAMCPAGETCFTASQCPAGASCSRAVDGLFFEGSFDAGDGTPRHIGTVAVGGTERVLLSSGADLESAARYTDRVRAESDTPDVLTVVSAEGGEVIIRGESDGTATLRILEPVTGTLLDRVSVTVGEVTGVTLASPGLTLRDSAIEVAVLAGTRTELGLSPLGSFGGFMVDRDMRLRDSSGTIFARGADGAPYAFELAARPAGRLELSAHFGGQDFPISLAVVDAIDGVDLRAPSNVLVDQTFTVCATGTAGEAELIGGPAASFTLSANAMQTGQTGNCIEAHARAAGSVRVDVTLAGATSSRTVLAR